MLKGLVKGSLLLAWAASMYWLVRHEAYPDRFAPEIAGYKSLARDHAEVSDTWMKILFNGAPIGYSHGTIQLNEEAKELELVMENATTVQLKLLGMTQRLKLNTKVMLNAGYELTSFELDASGAGQTASVRGSRLKDDRYEFKMNIAGQEKTQQVVIPSDTVIFSPYLEMAMKRMKPGDEVVMNGLDPLTMGRTKIRLKAEAMETVRAIGRDHLCTRLSVTVDGTSLAIWMDADGRVIRQTTPFGWVMEACDGNEAISLMDNKNNAATSLPIPGLFGPSTPSDP